MTQSQSPHSFRVEAGRQINQPVLEGWNLQQHSLPPQRGERLGMEVNQVTGGLISPACETELHMKTLTQWGCGNFGAGKRIRCWSGGVPRIRKDSDSHSPQPRTLFFQHLMEVELTYRKREGSLCCSTHLCIHCLLLGMSPDWGWHP